MFKRKYLDLVILQYKPVSDQIMNIEHIDYLLNKYMVKKHACVICHELSLQNYFCITKDVNNFKHAISINSKTITLLKRISNKYKIYLCVTIFEKSKDKYYNTAVIINPQGKIIKKYRKKNIPSETCYEERYYFDNPKNDYQFFSIHDFKIGILVCWDQWHSNAYQKLKKKKIDCIICPTAIGTCKHKNTEIKIANEKKKWINIIEANSLMINTPVVMVNRIGLEKQDKKEINFWGMSFITNAHGTRYVKSANRESVIKQRIYKKDTILAKKMWNFSDIG